MNDTSNCVDDIIVTHEWDDAKSAANIAAGRLRFEAIYDFEWETAIITYSPRHGEFRLAALRLIGNRLY